ncbi:CoA ester lyase [Bosea sp. F3-2]|uniref:HpcH/HpaI aldolase/citrate lyase family protein n=1 Tax=Bosea sp. F3-2 TaxID=2599640 RepID=UPI0011EBDCFF|nr:CoA ester lyase [Bosea sp. F3-2]QEL22874.1 CoA ester lyase [Bosea sp. F3-2]
MVNLPAIRAPLFVPADRPDRFAKAAASGTDAIILDLEDAVAARAKETARHALATGFTDLPVIVRLNAHGTHWHEADVTAVAGLDVSAAILPKAEDPATCAIVACRLGRPLIALIESARGLANARAIAATVDVARLAFGSVDYCADLGCAHLRDILLPARQELVLASRLAGIVAPLDGVTVRMGDPTAAYEDALHARNLGMTGKLCIHPSQIAEVKRAFAPSRDEIDWAHRVLATGSGVTSVDGAMVDEPVRIRARMIVEQVEER